MFARSPPVWTGDCPLVIVFEEHLTSEVRSTFGRLLLFGSIALEFLGGLGVMALANLVLLAKFPSCLMGVYGPRS